MGQEFIIKSQRLEDKINQLLPSQGGFQAGVDLSASTTVIPIVDLTETAENSTVREDLQKALSFNSVTPFSINNATNQTIINTTGYYRVFGVSNVNADTANSSIFFRLNDGASRKNIWQHIVVNTTNASESCLQFDFIVFLQAGHSLEVNSDSAEDFAIGCTRQIADISGNLVDP
jgi:hypothetical protein